MDTAHEWRGGQTQLLLLLQRQPGDVHVALRSDALILEAARRTGASLHVLPASRRLRSAWALRRVVCKVRPDVVAVHTSHAHTAALAVQDLAPVVVHRRLDFTIRGLSRRKYTAAHGFVAVSSAVRDELVRAGVSAERVAVVHDGIEPTGVLPFRGGGGIGALGALVGHKGHHVLVDAMSELPGLRCTIAGSGVLRPVLQRQINRHDLTERVKLPGRIANTWAFLSELDLFVHPSVEEGLGSAILEAMAAGVPVVASAAGGIPEIVEHGVTGRLFSPGDFRGLAEGVRAALREREATEAMVVRAQRRVMERHSAQAMVQGTVAAYERLAG